jgi:drug/metabolite transporter (DMT)-like permease
VGNIYKNEMQQALIYNLLSSFFSVLLIIVTKVMVTNGIIVSEIASFFRHVSGLVVVMPFFIKTLEQKPHHFVHKIPQKLMFLRALFFTITTFCWPIVYTHIPLHIAMTIAFLVPFLSNIMLVVFLKEEIPKHVWIVKIIGIIGVVIILEPHVHEFNQYYLIALVCVVFWAIATTLNKHIANKKVRLNISLYYLTVYSVVLTGIFVMLFRVPMPKNMIQPILYLGVISILAQWFTMHAYRHGKGYLVNAMEFIRFLMFLATDIILFGADLTFMVIVGSLLIGGSVLYIVKNYR